MSSGTFGAAPSADAEWHAVARAVASAENDAAPSVVFACRCSFSEWLAGVLLLVAAPDFGDPALAGWIVRSVAADNSCRLLRCRNSAP